MSQRGCGTCTGSAAGAEEESQPSLAAFARRGSLWEIPRKTSDPEKALRNLLERDRMFTEGLAAEAAALRLRVIEVDVTVTEGELAERVAAASGLS